MAQGACVKGFGFSGLGFGLGASHQTLVTLTTAAIIVNLIGFRV